MAYDPIVIYDLVSGMIIQVGNSFGMVSWLDIPTISYCSAMEAISIVII